MPVIIASKIKHLTTLRICVAAERQGAISLVGGGGTPPPRAVPGQSVQNEFPAAKHERCERDKKETILRRVRRLALISPGGLQWFSHCIIQTHATRDGPICHTGGTYMYERDAWAKRNCSPGPKHKGRKVNRPLGKAER